MTKTLNLIAYLSLAILMITVTALSASAQTLATQYHRINITQETFASTVSTPNHTITIEQIPNTQTATTANFTITVEQLLITYDDETNATTTLACISTWTCTGWVENGTFNYRTCTQIGDTTCTNTTNQPTEVTGLFSFWEVAIALIYITAVALFVLYGFTIRDKQLKEVVTDKGVERIEITNAFLTGLKLIFLFSAPGLALLGLHIAREIAIANNATSSITDSLLTAFNVMMWLTFLALAALIVILARNSLINLFKVSSEGLKEFRKGRFKKDGK